MGAGSKGLRVSEVLVYLVAETAKAGVLHGLIADRDLPEGALAGLKGAPVLRVQRRLQVRQNSCGRHTKEKAVVDTKSCQLKTCSACKSAPHVARCGIARRPASRRIAKRTGRRAGRHHRFLSCKHAAQALAHQHWIRDTRGIRTMSWTLSAADEQT